MVAKTYIPTADISLAIVAETPVQTVDRLTDPETGQRVICLSVGPITLYLGVGTGPDRDAEVVIVADRLIGALAELRDAAEQRAEEAA